MRNRKKLMQPRNIYRGEDIISSLPEFLLIHILSFVGDTKQAVKTCVLSKRWQFVWTHLLEVDLKEYSSDNKKVCRFVEYVDRMIAMCKSLNKLAIGFRFDKCFASNVNHWFNLALKLKVKDITLKLYGSKEPLPQMLYSYSSLSKLSVSNCDMAPPLGGIISWKSLESLKIGDVELPDSVMANILSSCPLLKILHLDECSGLNYLKIDSPILTTLMIRSSGEEFDDDKVMEISAPFLRVLSIENHDSNLEYRLTNVSSVVQATIELYNFGSDEARKINQMKQIHESLKSVEILELGPLCLEMISFLEVKSWKFPSYDQLWSLVLKVFSYEMSNVGILSLLRSSPNLRTLRIERAEVCPDEETIQWNNYDIRAEDCNMDLVAPHLRIMNFNKYIQEHDLTLFQILLKGTKSLEKMVITDRYPGLFIKSMKIAKRLLTFPRASPQAVIVLR